MFTSVLCLHPHISLKYLCRIRYISTNPLKWIHAAHVDLCWAVLFHVIILQGHRTTSRYGLLASVVFLSTGSGALSHSTGYMHRYIIPIHFVPLHDSLRDVNLMGIPQYQSCWVPDFPTFPGTNGALFTYRPDGFSDTTTPTFSCVLSESPPACLCNQRL